MRPLKVLILEDNPFQLMALHQMLNAFRIFDVLTAESVDSARESLLKCGAIDLAICDLYMDGTSGLELISELARARSARAGDHFECGGAPCDRKSGPAGPQARPEGVGLLV